MKRIVAFFFALLFLFGAVAETIGGLINPITEYASLEEINEIVGSNLARPAVMGVTDESFSVIDAGEYWIAQYCFCVNGLEYSMRCAPVAYEDISGVNLNGSPAYSDDFSGETEYVCADGMKLSRWFDINGQYVLCLSDPEQVMEEETFKLITEEMISLTSVVPGSEELEAFFDSLEGTYEDSFSERAWMEIRSNGSEGAAATVHWAESAFAGYDWQMNIKLGEDGLLYYTDCMETYTEYAQEEASVRILYEGGEGFFSYADGKLYWNGAAEESCRDCIFEKPDITG